MPLRRLDEEFDQEEGRSKAPELRARRSKIIRTEEILERADAREGVRRNAREDSRGSSQPAP